MKYQSLAEMKKDYQKITGHAPSEAEQAALAYLWNNRRDESKMQFVIDYLATVTAQAKG